MSVANIAVSLNPGIEAVDVAPLSMLQLPVGAGDVAQLLSTAPVQEVECLPGTVLTIRSPPILRAKRKLLPVGVTGAASGRQGWDIESAGIVDVAGQDESGSYVQDAIKRQSTRTVHRLIGGHPRQIDLVADLEVQDTAGEVQRLVDRQSIGPVAKEHKGVGADRGVEFHRVGAGQRIQAIRLRQGAVTVTVPPSARTVASL